MYFVALIARALSVLLNFFIWILLAQVVASWLVAFGVVNTRNRAVYTIIDMLDRVTMPFLRPIRRILPSIGGLDLSPLILFVLIQYIIQPILVDCLINVVCFDR